MDPHAPPSLLAPLHRLLTDERRRQATDRDLLQAFAQRGEHDAFAELLRRHGPMVLNLALHLLHHRQDAEDVFQATFLMLARNARSLRCETSAAAWLHRVAWRLAVRSRAASNRRSRPLPSSLPSPQRSLDDEISLREAQELLHQELAALLEHLRLPLVLCYLQGRTRDEAARRLGWSLATLKRRLEQGRKLLHVRLSRRGVTLPAVLSALLLSTVEVPASLIQSTVSLVASSLAGSASVPASVALLLAEMSLSVKAKAIYGLLLMLGACAGAWAWIYHGLGSEPLASPEARPMNSPPTADKGDKTPGPARDRFGDQLPPGALARMGTIRFRHGDTISSIALSPNDRTLLTASRDHTVRLWDVATGREVRRFSGHENQRSNDSPSAAFSPDGKIVGVGLGSSEPICLWDAATGKKLRELESPHSSWGHLAFSLDGKTLAAASERHRIAVWDAATGRLLHQLDGDDKKLDVAVPIAFSPDGRLLASGGLGESFHLWDVKTGKEQRHFTVQPPWPKQKDEASPRYGLVRAVAFSPDGRLLASAANSSPVRLWEAATGKEVRSLPGNRFGSDVLAFSPDGKTLACVEYSGIVRLWETATGKEIRRIDTHNAFVSGLTYFHDGKSLVTSGDSTIQIWEICSGAEITPDRGHSTRIISSVLSADGRTLITGGRDGDIRWWDVAAGKELRRIACLTQSSLWSGTAALSANGAMAAYQTTKPAGGKEAGEVHVGIELWDLAARKKLAELWRPNISATQFSPDEKTLFTKLWDVKQRATFIIAWDTATGKELRTLTNNQNGYGESLLLSADGKRLASVAMGSTAKGVERSVYVGDVATGKELCRVPASLDFDQWIVALSPDNKLLAVADGQRWRPDSRVVHPHIHLWDIATGKEIRQFGEAGFGYWAAAFSGDGKTLATAAQDNQIRLWETATGGERLHLAGHTGQINKLIFADNDRTLISTSADTTALVWDVTGLRRTAQVADQVRSSPSPQELWSALADPDAAVSYRAMCRLMAAPADALALLRSHLKPVEGMDEKSIEQLIADLDSDVFAVREKATRELRKLGELAEPVMRKALAKPLSPEMRRRLQELLDEVGQQQWRPSPEVLRQLRAIEVLERLSTSEARRLLETLAGGAAGARQTREACAALQRLRSVQSEKP
jgi:RNA polymerase sigma factor (sigma-70 family)